MIHDNTSIRLGSRLVSLRAPLVMAIINATPDSFFSNSRTMDEVSLHQAVVRARSEGADILDIGACSTRPAVQSGTGLATEQQEWDRLNLALSVIKREDEDLPVSVDTFRVQVAQQAIEQYGVTMINDISGGSPEMFDLVAHYGVAYVLTYNRQLMTTHYSDNMLADALAFFSRNVDDLHQRGVSDVVIDPGFGFGQTVQESLDLLDSLNALKHIGCPILVGLSRKRMAYQPYGLTPDSCLPQTLLLEQKAIRLGARILRVHDVAATYEMISKE